MDKATGKHANRPELRTALKVPRAGDEFTITKLDRLGRSIRDLHEIADSLAEREIRFIIIDTGMMVNFNDPFGKMFFGQLALFAEFERDLVAMPTNEGLAAARAPRPQTQAHPRRHRPGPSDVRGQGRRRQAAAYCRRDRRRVQRHPRRHLPRLGEDRAVTRPPPPEPGWPPSRGRRGRRAVIPPRTVKGGAAQLGAATYDEPVLNCADQSARTVGQSVRHHPQRALLSLSAVSRLTLLKARHVSRR
ncbi:recombinase family protein [Streptomyces sp. AgN23]|nr:recombinase family protein [Streptomyces sp. AgN23]